MGKHKERLEKLLGELNKSGAALDEPLPDLDLGSDDDDVSSFSDDDSDLDLDNLDRLASGGGSDSKLDAKVAARTAKLQERLAQLVEEVRRKDERAEERPTGRGVPSRPAIWDLGGRRPPEITRFAPKHV